MNRLPERFLRWYCKLCKSNIVFEITDEFRDQIQKEATYYPFPVIIRHREFCWSIIHLDADLNDRGAINTHLYIDIHTLPGVVIKKERENETRAESNVSTGFTSLDNLKQLEQLTSTTLGDTSKEKSATNQDSSTKLSLDQLSALSFKDENTTEDNEEKLQLTVKKIKKSAKKTTKTNTETNS
jgi:hypothetical protein